MIEYYKNLNLSDIVYTNEFGMKCTEIWKDIPDFVGIYQASDLGRLKSLGRYVSCHRTKFRFLKESILKQKIEKDGYLRIGFFKDEKKLYFRVSRIIGLCFCENKENKPVVNHKDGNKINNCAYNLEWATLSENTRHSYDNGLQIGKSGKDNPMTLLTEQKVLAIRRLHRVNPTFNILKLSKKLKVSDGTIHHILKNKTWKHLL